MESAYCSLCGDTFLSEIVDENWSAFFPLIFSESDDWKQSHWERRYYRGKPEDLNGMYFRIPSLWGYLYRSIIETCNGHNSTHHLSGVALYGYWNEYPENNLQVPRNPNEMAIGHPETFPFQLTQVELGSVNRKDPRPHEYGYPMHERCWALMTRIVDVTLIERHLGLFVDVLRQRRCQDPYQLDDLLLEKCGWTRLGMDKREISGTFSNLGEYARRYTGDVLHYYPRDPLNMPELRDLFEHPEKIQPKEAKKEIQDREKKRPSTKKSHRMSLRASSTYDTRNITVPTDIVLLIMDLLPEFRDIQALLWVFPQWRFIIPASYWRRRCIDELVLEESVPSAESLDWRYLYFHIDSLLAHSHGWRNRRRIMSILEGTRELFLKLIT